MLLESKRGVRDDILQAWATSCTDDAYGYDAVQPLVEQICSATAEVWDLVPVIKQCIENHVKAI